MNSSNGAYQDLIVTNARIRTMDPNRPEATAFAVQDGKFTAVGTDAEVEKSAAPGTRRIDARGRVMIPGLHDSHLHVIRGGRMYAMELRWDGVPSLADGLRMLREQVERTPPGLWVRVVGGWSEFQFAERRMPTLDELNAIAPDTPVFVLHLYHLALLNRAALKAAGIDRNTPNPPRGEIQKDASGEPTGLIVARPDASLLYATLAKAPSLDYQDQINSTIHFNRELNRFGLTSACDAGGGTQFYPDDYKIFSDLASSGKLSMRVAYSLFTQHPGGELADYQAWTASTTPGNGTDWYRHNGAGELICYTGYDFEDFPEPRPEPPASMEDAVYPILDLLVKKRWPFRIHATYNESIEKYLDVIERVNGETPLNGLRWFFDHAETITEQSIERVKALGGGIAIQDRLAFQGEYFVERYGTKAAMSSPPIAAMLAAGLPVGAGTDGTRVSSYNPWLSIHWLVTGKTLGGLQTRGRANLLDREAALRLYTVGSAWFSGEVGMKGSISPGQLADAVALSDDYFAVEEDAIRGLTSVLTIVGGTVVHATDEFKDLAPPALPVSPSWSPVRYYGGYQSAIPNAVTSARQHHAHAHAGSGWRLACGCFA